MNYIDFHTHIDFFQNYREIYQQYVDEKIYALFVTNLPEIFSKHYQQFNTGEYVRLALGYHPALIQSYDLNKDLFLNCLDKTDYIGEVGIDNSRNSYSLEKQIDNFEYIVRTAGEKKVYSIHTRNSENIVLPILKNYKIKFAVFHWYTGSLKTIDEIIKEGYYFSINYRMLGTDNGKKILSKIPKELLLFESDAPHVKFNKSDFSPHLISELYKEFEKYYGINSFQELIFKNFKELLFMKRNFKII